MTFAPRGTVRKAFLVGVLAGAVVGLYLDWYFTQGPAAGSADRGMAHGFWILMLGFPLSSLLPSLDRMSAVACIALSWGIFGAAARLIVRGLRR